MRSGGWWRVVFTTVMVVALSIPARAQSPHDADHEPGAPHVELDGITFYGRYHYVENSSDKVTSNLSQYKSALRAHLNIDRGRRVSVHVGAFSGSTFISTWNALGVGPGELDPRHHFVKQLFVDLAPIHGVEAQYGSLYILRGEEDEITSYDDDGYLTGERVSLKPPAAAHLDELVVTRGEVGPYNQPNVFARWGAPSHANYGQALIAKRLTTAVAASLEYATQSGADAFHSGITVHLPPRAPYANIRYEKYRRVTHHAASGFAIWADRSLITRARVQGGYATVDQFFGGWNADRMQSGRRVFASMLVALGRGVAVQVFATRAFASRYAIPIKTRIDLTVNYDVLSALGRSHWF